MPGPWCKNFTVINYAEVSVNNKHAGLLWQRVNYSCKKSFTGEVQFAAVVNQ
jgi:hypothetical protein